MNQVPGIKINKQNSLLHFYQSIFYAIYNKKVTKFVYNWPKRKHVLLKDIEKDLHKWTENGFIRNWNADLKEQRSKNSQNTLEKNKNLYTLPISRIYYRAINIKIQWTLEHGN